MRELVAMVFGAIFFMAIGYGAANVDNKNDSHTTTTTVPTITSTCDHGVRVWLSSTGSIAVFPIYCKQ